MTAPLVAEHTYRYGYASEWRTGTGTHRIDLATSGGCGEQPWLAEGFVATPQPFARALLVVAQVAATRFWTPPNMVAAAILAADPVVTAGEDAVRFEAFSACCGVYAGLTVDREAFDGEVYQRGSTNVDVNAPLRAALARVGRGDPLRLSIGRDELSVATLDGRVVERRVPLPERWVRGFAEVPVALSALDGGFALDGAGLRRFLDQLPTTPARRPGWVVPSGRSARISTRPAAGAIPAGGVERLRVLRGLGPFASSLQLFGLPATAGDRVAATSGWLVHLEGATLTLALSPAAARGFSGEGGLLHALARGRGGASEPSPLTTDTSIDAARRGHLGYDLSGGTFFDRHLPFDRSTLGRSDDRLARARALVDAGGVHLDATRSAARVTSGADEYRVRWDGDAWRCTCPWWAQHHDDRGPCRHVLATVLAAGQAAGQASTPHRHD